MRSPATIFPSRTLIFRPRLVQAQRSLRPISRLVQLQRHYSSDSKYEVVEQEIVETAEATESVEQLEVSEDLPSTTEPDVSSVIKLLETTAAENLPQAPLSGQVENQLNKEFDRLMQEFVTYSDIRSVFPELSPPEAKVSSKDRSGNIKGSTAYPNLKRSNPSEPYTEQELYLRQRHHAATSAKLGAKLTNIFRPQNDLNRPPSPSQTSITTLLAAGAHLGHSVSLLRPSTLPYIHGVRDGIHIIDLEQTLSHLRRAAKVAEGISEKGGVILYIGTREGQQRSLETAVQRSGGYYVHRRWIPGTLTNCREISSHWKRMEVDMEDKPTGRELSPGLQVSFVRPDLVVILNPVENRNAISECIQSRIPTIGIVDTDSEPTLFTYPIPANDDSIRATNIIVGILSKAAERGRLTRLRRFKEYQDQLKTSEEEQSTGASVAAEVASPESASSAKFITQ